MNMNSSAKSPANSRAIPELPRHLWSWSAYLGWIDPHLAPDVAALAQRLETLLSSFFTHTRTGSAEPDGYAGITRKGPPERLLLSEWALLEEMPDEFMRRAAMGEQYYLDPQRSDPHERQSITLLLDCGPMQWGAPRLLHLALLVILVRRAAALNASLRWAALQKPDSTWQHGVDKSSMRRWLKSNVTEAVNDKHIQAWQQRLEDESTKEQVKDSGQGDRQKPSQNEIWLVGSALFKQRFGQTMTSDFRQVYADENIEPEHAEELDVMLQYKQRMQQFFLPLPEMKIQTRLLRNPFRQDVDEPIPQLSPANPGKPEECVIRFNNSGTRLLVRQPLNKLRIVDIHNNEAGHATLRDANKSSAIVIGACSLGAKKTFILQAGSDGLLYLDNAGAWMRATKSCQWVTAQDNARQKDNKRSPMLLRQGWHQSAFIGRFLFVVDALERLWKIDTDSKLNTPEQIARDVIFMTSSGQYIDFIQRIALPYGLKCFRHIPSKSESTSFSPFWALESAIPPDAPRHISAGKWQNPILAWKDENDIWNIVHMNQFVQIPGVSASERVVGVVVKEKTDAQTALDTGLLLLSSNGQLLMHQSTDKKIELLVFKKLPVAIEYHNAAGLLAYVDMGGMLTVIKLGSGKEQTVFRGSLGDITDQSQSMTTNYSIQKMAEEPVVSYSVNYQSGDTNLDPQSYKIL